MLKFYIIIFYLKGICSVEVNSSDVIYSDIFLMYLFSLVSLLYVYLKIWMDCTVSYGWKCMSHDESFWNFDETETNYYRYM